MGEPTREELRAVAFAIWDEMRGRSGIKHFFLHVPGKRSEGQFRDHEKWLTEVAKTVITTLRALPHKGDQGNG